MTDQNCERGKPTVITMQHGGLQRVEVVANSWELMGLHQIQMNCWTQCCEHPCTTRTDIGFRRTMFSMISCTGWITSSSQSFIEV